MGKHSNIDMAVPAEEPFVWPELKSEHVISSALRAALPSQVTTSSVELGPTTVQITGPLAEVDKDLCMQTILSVDDHDVTLWCDKDVLRFVLALFEHNPEVEDYPADTLPLIFEHLTQPILEKLQKPFEAETISIATHGRAKGKPTGDFISFSMMIESHETYFFAVEGPASVLKKIASLFGSNPQERQTVRLDQIPFDCRLLGQDFEVSSSDLVALKPEDVLVLDAAWFDTNALVLTVADTLTATASDDNGALCLVNTFQPQIRKTAMPDLDPTSNELPVTVSIELARKDVVLSELEGLSAGDAIAFHKGELKEVSLTANGAHLGNGVLVKIDDQIAIRLTEVA